MPPLALSDFAQVLLAGILLLPVLILWVVAIVDVFEHDHVGWRLVGVLALILFLPVVGPLAYLLFRTPAGEEDTAEEIQRARSDLHREESQRPIGGSGVYR